MENNISLDTTMEVGGKVIETKKHQYVACGVSNSPFTSFKSAYIVKTDSFGGCIWKKQYDIEFNYSDFFADIVELPDSNYLICGTTGNQSLNLDEVLLTKIDTNGNIIWLKRFPYPNYNEQARGMKLTPDGKVLIIGTTYSTSGLNDGLLLKTDLNGNLIWRKTITNTLNYSEIYYNIDPIKNNTEYIISGMKGYYNTGNPYFDMSIMRTDTAGNPLWQQQYGIANIDDTGNGGFPTLDSGYVLCGNYNGLATLLKVDKQGMQEWVKNYSLEQYSTINQVIQLRDSSYVIIMTDVDWTNSNRTGYLIKCDKNGAMLWKRLYPHPTPSIGNYFFGFNTTADKGFIITGQYNHIGQPYQNMWLVKTDSLGCDSTGGCSYLPTGIKENSSIANTNNFKIYPNPNNGTFKILCDVTDDVNDKVVTINITNIVGQVIYTVNELNNTNVIELNNLNLNKGIYIVTIMQKHGVLGQSKLIIE